MKSNDAGDSLLMFIVGFALGAGVALLTAPQSGKRTRKQMTRLTEDAQEYLEEMGQELVDKGRELVEQGRSLAKEKIAEVKG